MNRIYLFLLSILFNAGAQAQAAPDLAQARSLLSANQPAAALKLLGPHEDAQAGNLEFDYLLGVAALEAGDASRATILLERALLVNPNHAGARLDLARAYFALGDRERARTEFNIVLSQDPPAAARGVIQSYLTRMEGNGFLGGKTRASGYLDVTAGRDSNVNNATSLGQVFVPVFGFNVQLSPTSQRTADTFASLGGGGEVSHDFNKQTSLFAGADLRLRFNRNADTFNYNQFDVRGGVQHAFSAASQLRASVAHQQYYLDNINYRGTSGLNLEWRHALSETHQIALFGTGNRVRYKDINQVANDTNLGVFGAGYTHVLNAQRRTTVSVSGVAGYERDVGQRVDGDRKLYGLRIGAQTGWGANVDWYVGAGYQPSRYQTRNVVFNEQRTDKLADAVVGAVWRIDRAWMLRPQVTYTRNASNIDINQFDRYEASIMLRRDFK